MPPSCKTGRKHLSRICGRRFQTCLSPPAPGLLCASGSARSAPLQPTEAFHRVHRISTFSATAIPVSRIQKGNSKTLHLPPPSSSRCSCTGKDQAGQQSFCSDLIQQFRVKKKNQKMTSWPFLVREANSLSSSILHTSIIIPASLKKL